MPSFGMIKGGVKQEYNIGGGADAKIRYLEERDVVQLYYNGQWVDWKSGGMAYPVGTEIIFDYTGAVEEFIIPATGNWKLEVWGAEGGYITTYASSARGGKGGYSRAVAYLEVDDEISVAVGGHGYIGTAQSRGTIVSGGFNGGGHGYDGYFGISCSGGGATHIAMGNRGELKEYAQFSGDILIVAGGGGASVAVQRDTPWYYANGGAGAGGNNNGVAGTTINYSHAGVTTAGGGGGTQSAGGSGTRAGAFGHGGNTTKSTVGSYTDLGGGGGGYYGGGAGGSDAWPGTGGGGSGYIKSTLTDIDWSNGVREGNGYAKLTYLGRGVA